MKTAIPSPITCENFTEAWKSIDELRRRAKLKYVTNAVSSFFSQMVFALLLLFACNGLIYDHLKGSYCDFLESLPCWLPIWQGFAEKILKISELWYIRAMITALAVYLTSFLVCGLFVLLTPLIYHPKHKEVPTGTEKENAEALLGIAKDARRYSHRTESGVSIFWSLIFMLAGIVLVALYAFSLQDMMRLYDILGGFMLMHPYLNVMVCGFGIYLAYSLLATIHAAITQPLYKFKVPYSVFAEAEYYSIFAGGESAGPAPEELEVKLAEALEYERLGATGKAKELIAYAAHAGNAAAMEHYARHHLIANSKDPAKYWLQRSIDAGNTGKDADRNLKRLKWNRKVEARYLK